MSLADSPAYLLQDGGTADLIENILIMLLKNGVHIHVTVLQIDVVTSELIHHITGRHKLPGIIDILRRTAHNLQTLSILGNDSIKTVKDRALQIL